MILQECLDKLARGKLGNLAVSSGGKINPTQIPKIVDAINEALDRLHTVLPLKEKSVLLELYEGRTEYELTSEHSFRKATGTIYDPYNFYIRDTDYQPFEDDILTVIEVWDDLDRKRPINDPESPLAIFIPDTTTLIVEYAIDCRVLNVIYRAKHKLLTPDDVTSKVDIPSNLYGALFSYVAYLIHSDLNTENSVQNAQKNLSEYQNIIQEIIQNGTLNPDKLVMNQKFIRRGWV